MQAVKSGDMEATRRMVDEAAKAAGCDVGPVWHGTPDGRFMKTDPVFKSKKQRFGVGSDAGVYWFTNKTNC